MQAKIHLGNHFSNPSTRQIDSVDNIVLQQPQGLPQGLSPDVVHNAHHSNDKLSYDYEGSQE